MRLWNTLLQNEDFSDTDVSKKGKYMYIIYALLAAVLIASDFAVKQFILNNVEVGATFGHFTPLFDFTYVRNTGAAFSMLSGKMGILAIVSILFCIGAIVFFIIKRPKSKLLCFSVTLMFAGALGNAVDRIFYGYVVDFIQTTFINFAVFNIADMAITIGAVLLVLYMLFEESGKSEKR